jgi:glucose/arabinose dehydrogenase
MQKLLSLWMVIFALGGCGQSAKSAADGAVRPDAGGSDALPGPDAATRDCTAVVEVTGRPSLQLAPIVSSGLAALTDIAFPPGDSTRIFVTEQHSGRIRLIKDGQLVPGPFLDLGSEVSQGEEQGLLSLAFHPAYQQNRRFYVYYTDSGGDVQVVEYQRQSNSEDVGDSTTARTLLSIAEPESNHNGGAIRFLGSSSSLYVGVGDGGGGGDDHGPIGNAQKKDTLLGKMLRIDVDREQGGKPYGIPLDNPFVGDAAFAPEIFHWGLRNPWRFSFDFATGELWIGDVGQNAWEEIDFVSAGAKGKNFGWRCREGLESYKDDAHCASESLIDPVLVKPNGAYCSIIPGYRYRGCRMPGYRGTFFYGDYCQGTIHSFQWNGAAVTDDQAVAGVSVTTLTSWGEDHQGELYLVTGNGQVFRLDPK